MSVWAKAISGGISVTPSILRIDLAHDLDQQELIYTNKSTDSIALHLQVRNFTALEDGWKVQFLQNSDSSNFQYSLSSWIKFDNDTVLLAPNETKTVKIYIDKQNLPPGAHYASIQAVIEQTSKTGALGVQQALSSLLFVRGATGTQHPEGRIQSLVTNSAHFTFPSTAEFVFNNTGNVESAPYGELRITSRTNKLIGKGIVNTDSLLSLPESVRTYPIRIQQLQSFIFPGFYTATLSIHLDQDTSQITYTTSFFSLGSISIQEAIYGALFATLLLLSFVRLRTR